MAVMCYKGNMKTLTLRIDASLDRWLTEEGANALGRTKSALVREALLRQRNGARPLSVHDRMKEVCGIIKGPRDLSTNPKYLEGFGE